MGRAGRLQGEPKGETVEANALAVFLREITKGRTVRELAKCYGAGKTSWSDYRSGTKTIPWEILERVVCSRVRDSRSRTELLARAQRLHAAACAAEAGRGSMAGEDAPPASPPGRTPSESRDDGLHTGAQLAEAEGLVRTLLGLTARLQSELDDALLRAGGRSASSAPPAAEARPEGSARTWPGVEGDGPGGWPPTPSAADDEGKHPQGGAPAEQPGREWPGAEQGAGGPPRGEILLRHTYPLVRRGGEGPPLFLTDAEVAIRRRNRPGQRAGSGQADVTGARVCEAVVISGQVVQRSTGTAGGRRLPVVARQGPLRRGWLWPGWGRRALLLACAIVAFGAAATGLDVMPPPRAEAGPHAPGPLPPASAEGRDTVSSPGAPVSSRPSGTAPALRPSSPSALTRTTPSSEPSPGRAPSLPAPQTTRLPAEVPAPRGSGVYAIAHDGRAVLQWSGTGTGWLRIGGPAKELYAGPAGVFATDPKTGELRGYSGVPGNWETVSERAAAFATSGTQLYRLAQDHSAVHRWNRELGTWTRIGGPAGRLYGGGAGLFATDPVDGRIFAYGGKGDVWTYAGGAGADFAVSDHHLYGLNPERSGVFRWSGEAGVWSAVGGPAGALYAGPSDLYATNETDGGLWRYREGAWAQIGEAGAGFGARADRAYRLDRESTTVWEWQGTEWRRIGGPVRSLVVAG